MHIFSSYQKLHFIKSHDKLGLLHTRHFAHNIEIKRYCDLFIAILLAKISSVYKPSKGRYTLDILARDISIKR